MYICYGSSDSYASHTGISIISLLDHNRDLPIEKIFVLDYGIADENKRKLLDIAGMHTRVLDFIDANGILSAISRQTNIKSCGGSYATYSRAFIDRIIPDYVNEVLYIDSDTIINKPLNELLGLDMNNKVMAAVIGTNQYGRSWKNDELITMTNNHAYYQCGVVLFNLVNWKKHEITKKIIETCLHGTDFRNADQTLINNSIEDQYILPLHPKFNYWGHIYPRRRELSEMAAGHFWSTDMIMEARNNPIIVHYKGPYTRPWVKGSVSRLNHLYLFYKEHSPWADLPLDLMKDVIKYPDKGPFKRFRAFLLLYISQIPFVWLAKLVSLIGSIIKKRELVRK